MSEGQRGHSGLSNQNSPLIPAQSVIPAQAGIPLRVLCVTIAMPTETGIRNHTRHSGGSRRFSGRNVHPEGLRGAAHSGIRTLKTPLMPNGEATSLPSMPEPSRHTRAACPVLRYGAGIQRGFSPRPSQRTAGDHAGNQSRESLSVSCTTPVPSAFIT